jgi:hypothetical protein
MYATGAAYGPPLVRKFPAEVPLQAPESELSPFKINDLGLSQVTGLPHHRHGTTFTP